MDSDHSSSPSPAGKIYRCAYGKRMSSLKFDFHNVCTDCRGIDCGLEARCIQCTNVPDLVMQDYVSHKLSLKHKLLAKRKHKVPLPPSMVMHEPEVFVGDLPPGRTSLVVCIAHDCDYRFRCCSEC